MQRRPTLELAQRALRAAICTACPHRPPGSENLGANVPRPCETHCRLFVHLPVLYERAKLLDPMLACHRKVIGEMIKSLTRGSAPKQPCRSDGLTRQSKSVTDTLTNLFTR